MKAAPPRQRGFSLVEVMVAIVVICVGLLGIAKMQGLALSNTTTSRQRALAAIQAASLAAAMHSNRVYWANTPAGFNVTLNAGLIASSDAALAGQATLDIGNATACVGTLAGAGGGLGQCTPVQLAASDFANWAGSLNGLLPNPVATVACPAPPPNIPTSCTIQLSWSEKAVGMNQTEAKNAAAGGQFENPTYMLYVQP